MTPLFGLLLIIVSAVTFVALSFWLERKLRKPGLGFLLSAAALFVGAALGYATDKRLLPTLFFIQAIGLLYSARWRRNETRDAGVGAIEA